MNAINDEANIELPSRIYHVTNMSILFSCHHVFQRVVKRTHDRELERAHLGMDPSEAGLVAKLVACLAYTI
jgi:hypothetical protein